MLRKKRLKSAHGICSRFLQADHPLAKRLDAPREPPSPGADRPVVGFSRRRKRAAVGTGVALMRIRGDALALLRQQVSALRRAAIRRGGQDCDAGQPRR